MLIELFLLDSTGEAAFSLQRGQFDPKFQVEGIAPTTILFLRKTELSVHSYGI